MTQKEGNEAVIVSAEEDERIAQEKAAKENRELLTFVGLPALVTFCASSYYNIGSPLGLTVMAAACGMAVLLLRSHRIQ
jgi:hypothetical protein